MAEFDWDEFEAAVHLLKSGVKELPFRDVIKAATGYQITQFNEDSRNPVRMISVWIENNLQHLSNYVETEYEGRSNELGNFVEAWLIDALDNQLPLSCKRPRTGKGHAQAVGYPDGIIQNNEVNIYFDIKIYQGKTKDTTLRSFYYQPTNQSKIHHDAPHFLIGFEVESLGGSNRSPFKVIDFTIVDIYEMMVLFKAEFNTSNRFIYQLMSPLGD
jgi:hypothetical protein